LVLTTVPLAWGTFEVAVRYVYALEELAVPTFLFNLSYYFVATAALVPAAILWSRNGDDDSSSTSSDPIGTTPLEATETTMPNETIKNNMNNNKNNWPVVGGMELGTYLFVGNLLQVVGLQTVPADRAAFLLQLTTVFVPLAQANRSARVWVACGLALAGVGIMGLDDSSEDASAVEPSVLAIVQSTLDRLSQQQQQLQWSTGDSLIVLAAVSYTFHCIRLEGYAQQTSAVRLAACKATAETTWSAVAVLVVILSALSLTPTNESGSNDFTAFLSQSGQECLDFVAAVSTGLSNGSVSTASLLPAVLATIWTGLVPVAYTIAAQSYGQRRVRPVTANLIYTIQPVCTAVFAYLLLHESLGLLGYIGGALIGSAVLLVVAQQDETSNAKINASGS